MSCKTLVLTVSDFSQESKVFKIREDYDLVSLLEAWCPVGKELRDVALKVKRTGRCITIHDKGIIAKLRLQDGDHLEETY